MRRTACAGLPRGCLATGVSGSTALTHAAVPGKLACQQRLRVRREAEEQLAVLAAGKGRHRLGRAVVRQHHHGRCTQGWRAVGRATLIITWVALLLPPMLMLC